ncbi:MAG: hypothetical protein HKN32_04540, partial [Flavobacteriales bacterium]|nr:hypothetical protein [Flavobacteriales bacterium]
MKFTLVIACIAASVISLAQSQVTSRTFGGPWHDNAEQIIEAEDGGYYVIGTTGSAQNVDSDIYLLKLDDMLDYSWSRVIGGSASDRGTSLCLHPDGGVMLFGYSNSYGTDGYNPIMVHVDANGEEQELVVLDQVEWQFSKDIFPHPDGGYIITYHTYGGEFGNQDLVISHVASDGTANWELSRGGPELDEWGDLILGENQVIYAYGTKGIDEGSAAYLLGLDLAGSTVVEFDYGDGEYTGNGVEVVINGIVLVGGYRHFDEGGLDHYISKFSFDGELVYERLEFTDLGEEVLHDVVEIDNGFICVGRSNAFGFGGFGVMVHRKSPS